MARIHDSNEKLKCLLLRGPTVLWTSEPSGNYQLTFISENVHNVLGWTQPEFLRPGFWQAHVHPDDLPDVISKIETGVARGQWHLECRLLHRDGQYRFVQGSGVAVKNNSGKIVEFVGHVVDVTPEKQAEVDRLEREKLRLFAEALIAAQEAERKRISRELHDDLSQRLASVILEIGLLYRNPPESVKRFGEPLLGVKKELIKISDDVRRIAYQLHSTGLEQFGLRAALEQECTVISDRTKIKINFKSKPTLDMLPENVSICLYRVAQECLRNAITHSKAKRVAVTLDGSPNEIQLCVSDNGVGFDLSEVRMHQSLGLISMEERLRQVGGALVIDSTGGRGTRIEARVPLQT
jgi:PAS domain S-box-containing protein